MQTQRDALTAINGVEAFIGSGAVAFSNTIDQYIAISKQHTEILEQATGVIGTCIDAVMGAGEYAASHFMNEALVSEVVGRLTHDAVVQDGASAVMAIIYDMVNTAIAARSQSTLVCPMNQIRPA